MRAYFLIPLVAANVGLAEDGNQQRGQQSMRGTSIQVAPQQTVPRGSSDASRRVVPAEAPRRGPAEVPRGAAPTETPRGSAQTPRGAVETPRRVEMQRRAVLEAQRRPSEAQRRGASQNVFDSSPSMSRIQRFRQQAQKGTTGTRQDVQTFLQTRRRAAAARTAMQSQQAVQKALPKQIQSQRQASVNVNARIKSYRPTYSHAFNDTFFARHQYYPSYYHRGIDWWRPYPWVVINNFLGWGWAYPVYFDMTGYPIPVYPDPAYAPGAGYASEGVYATDQPAGDWLSLGVFVAGRSEDEAAYSPMFVQIAIDKEGVLSGTYYNASTDQVHPLEGLVDRDSQQTIWKVADSPDSPIMTTGLYNLTQDMAQVQVHFSDGSEQSWILVRLRP